MREIRLCWNASIRHAQHEIEIYRRWAPASPEARRDLAIIARTANEIYGAQSHWVEEREVRRPDSDARLRFDARVLQGDEEAGVYARQLAKGMRALRFEPTLETDYADRVRAAQRRSAVAAAWLGMAVWLVAALCALLGLSLLPGVSSLRDAGEAGWMGPGFLVIALGAGAFLLRDQHLAVRTDHAAVALLVLVAVVIGFMSSEMPDGAVWASLALAGVIAAGFFPLGLLFWQSLMLGVCIAAGATLLLLWMSPGTAGAAALQAYAVPWGALVLTGFGAYWREHAHRQDFLLSGLLDRQAYVDPLTGLYNRRGTDRLTQTARLQALRDNVTISFVLIDIDRFSEYNQHHGREAADTMLVDVTQVIASFARRPLDVAGRQGGKRFGLLLYDCSLAQAHLHAERLRERLRDATMPQEGAKDATREFTVSMGAVQVLPDETAEDFVKRAEALLMRSKAAGRDRVTIR
ncbi:MAG: GGDEF domain-containing protein [Variovorax sp.]|nr:MAG: GGDEF domain-containing protein [Variovorax sp.]